MTIFEKIINKQIPAQIVYEDERALAFKDINPVAPVHCLIIPKKRITNIASMEEADLELMGHLMFVCQKVAQIMKVQDYRIISNNGEGAGQSVFHLHFHLIAGRELKWPPG